MIVNVLFPSSYVHCRTSTGCIHHTARRPGSRLSRVTAAFLGLLLEVSTFGANSAQVANTDFEHLTHEQRKILASPSIRMPSPKFDFSRPPGPQFSELEKASQRKAGERVLPVVLESFKQGAAVVRIPPGDYRFGHERWDAEGVVYALQFAGLKRDSEHTFTIDATGVTFWFDLPDDQAPAAHFAVGFKECENVVFRGATLDRGTRGHVEGQITAIDFPGNRIEIQLSPGLELPAQFNDQLEQRILPFKADGAFCAPLYALQWGGTKLKYRKIIPGTQPRRAWVQLCEPALLQTIQDPDWQRAYGEQGTLRVGDGLSCVYSVSCAIELERCRHLTMDQLKVYLPKSWGAEWGGDGGHLWKNCYFGPRPGTSQWQGGEGFMFCATRQGTTLDHVCLRHTGDDVANFHGYWGNPQQVDGARMRFELSYEFRRTVLRDARPGDRLWFRDKLSGGIVGEARLVERRGEEFVLDRPVSPFTNTIVEWPDHACAGWTIQHCDWQDNYQRLLIQSGPGIVRYCSFTRQGSGIELNSVMPYIEGGVPRDITIAHNVFTDVNPRPHGAAIGVYSHTFGPGALTFSNIVIRDNKFIRPGETAVSLENVTCGEISGNRILRPLQSTALARPREPRRNQAIWLKNCQDVRVEKNRVKDPGHYASEKTSSAASTK